MKHSGCLKRFLCAVLSASITLSLALPAFAANASGSLITSQTVGESTVYTRQTVWSADGKINQYSYITYSPNTTVSPIVLYGNKLYGKSTLSEIAAYAENGGFNIIGGINADFFTMANGLPCGIVVNNTKLISSDGWQYGVGFNADGTSFIGKPLLKIKAESDTKLVTITGINKLRTDVGVYMLTDDFSSNTQISSNGLNVILQPDEGSLLQIGQTVRATVEAVERQSASTAIPSGKIILTAANAIAYQLEGFNVGDRVAITVSSDDARWNNVSYAVGGGALLVENGAAVPQTDKSTNPRSAIGVKSDGSLIIFTVDGRQSGYSNGMTLAQLAEKLVSLGCVTALNLDGGGSTTFGLKSPGYFPVSLTNKPSDGSQRRCANFIFLATRGNGSGEPEHLHLYPDRLFALPGAEISFSAKATDDRWAPVEIDGQPSVSVDEQLGTVNSDNILTVSDSPKAGKVYGELYGMKDELTIGIADDIDWFGITNDGSHEVSQINLKDGEQLDLKISAYYKSRPVAVSDKMFSWTISNPAAGSIDQNGVITAGASGTFATVTASYGNLKKTVQLTVGKAPLSITDFEDGNLFDAHIVYTDDDSSGIDTPPSETMPSDGEDITEPTSPDEDSASTEISDKQDENKDTTGTPETNLPSAVTGELPNQTESPSSASQAGSQEHSSVTGESQQPSGSSGQTGDETPSDGDSSHTDSVSVFSQTDFAYIKYGYASAGIKYSLSERAQAVKLTPKFTSKLNGASALSVWLYSDNSGNSLTARGVDENGNTVLSADKHTLDFSGWQRLVFSFDNPISSISELRITADGNSRSGAVYFDNLRALYGSTAEDLSAPVISLSSPSDNAEFVQGSAVSLQGSVSDGAAPYISAQSISVTVDGVKIPFEYNREHSALTASVDTASLKGGLHRLTVTAEDSAGNLSRHSQSFTITSEAQSVFIDSTSHWSREYIDFLYSKGIITGENTASGMKFNPERPITRTEMAVIMARFMGYSNNLANYESVTLDFTDAEQIPSWALPYIKAVFSEQLMLGKALPDGSSKFDPDANLTRAEAMTLLGRTVCRGYAINNPGFADASQIPEWSMPHISLLCSLGIVNGYSSDNTIRPLNNIKRGEITSILCNLY